jgi:hypothetical protein
MIYNVIIFEGLISLEDGLCRGCNTGLGLFNDNLRGLLVGALYLEKDPQKIIDELNYIISRKELDDQTQ